MVVLTYNTAWDWFGFKKGVLKRDQQDLHKACSDSFIYMIIYLAKHSFFKFYTKKEFVLVFSQNN